MPSTIMRKSKSNESLDRSSNHSHGSKQKRTKPRSHVSIHSFLDKESSKRSSTASSNTPPLDEISLSSSMSSHSNATELTMNDSIVRGNSSGHLRTSRRSRVMRQHSSRSATSQTGSTCGSMLGGDSTSGGGLDPNAIIMVAQLWERVKLEETYKQDMAEQCILRMMEMDAGTRKKLRLPSLRGPRYDQVSHTISYVVENIVSILGPDLEDFLEQVYSLSELCIEQGINPRLLGEATAAGVAHILGEQHLKPEHKQAWKSTFDFLSTKMNDCSWTN